MGKCAQGVAEPDWDVGHWDRWANGRLLTRYTYNKSACDSGYVAPRTLALLVSPHLPEGAVVLDVGCGTGLLGKMLSHYSPNIIIDGLDFSKGMVREIPEEIYREIFFKDLESEVPVKKCQHDEYDAIVSSGVYGDFVDIENLPKLFPALKKRAIVAVCGDSRFLEDGPELLNAEGFNVEISETHFAYRLKGLNKNYTCIVATR